MQYVFTDKARADFGFLAGGTGVSGVLVQMFGSWILGTAAGEYCQKHETLAVRGLQYVFCRQGWTDFRFLSRWHGRC
ncbi:MAG: hypothetical protein AN483_06960 [Aphanizomenon flos-aquae MDT14a]|nr:MAG: hypothetical protein AN483_06960 [Aphanizomenon flos-aquae MDT14a]